MQFLLGPSGAVVPCMDQFEEPSAKEMPAEHGQEASPPIRWTGKDVLTPHDQSSGSKRGIWLTVPMPEAQLGWEEAAAYLASPLTRLRDGVQNGEYPATDPQGSQPFSLTDLRDIRVIDRLRREAEDHQAAVESRPAANDRSH